jgi:Tol biopolymer transport system component
MLRRGTVLVVVALLFVCVGCHKGSNTNPFGGSSSTRPAPADAALVFVTGSWATDPGQPRELVSIGADGSNMQRLTACAAASDPCEVVQVALSPDRNRAAAIRASAKGAPGTSTLYFMDLSRSVEKLLFPSKRIGSVDWSPDGVFLVYAAAGTPQDPGEDLFYAEPNGNNDQDLTNTPGIRERSPRVDPHSQTAVYERIDDSGLARIYLYQQTPITAGGTPGPPLPGTPYIVGSDADPAYAPDASTLTFRRLTGIDNGGLGSWDVLTVKLDGTGEQTLATGGVYRGAPDWGRGGIAFVETDAAAAVSRLVVVQPNGSGRKVLREEPSAFGMASPRWIPGN